MFVILLACAGAPTAEDTGALVAGPIVGERDITYADVRIDGAGQSPAFVDGLGIGLPLAIGAEADDTAPGGAIYFLDPGL